MSKPIYRLALVKMAESWYALTSEERDAKWAAMRPARDGHEQMIGCFSHWGAEQWDGFVVDRFTDLASLKREFDGMLEQEWFQYTRAMVLLGTTEDMVEQVKPASANGDAGPVYKLFMIRRFSPELKNLTPEQQQAKLQAVRESLKNVGGRTILGCDCGWSNESYLFFGVEEFPDLEAVQEHYRCLSDLNWFDLIETESLLGSLMPAD